MSTASPYRELGIPAHAYPRRRRRKMPDVGGILKAPKFHHYWRPDTGKRWFQTICKFCRQPRFAAESTQCPRKPIKTTKAPLEENIAKAIVNKYKQMYPLNFARTTGDPMVAARAYARVALVAVRAYDRKARA